MASVRPVALAAAVVAGALLAAGGARSTSESVSTPGPTLSAYALDGRIGLTAVNRSARAAIDWRGGRVTASTGKVVNVFVSSSLPTETPEKWAELIAGFTHGPELPLLTARIALLAEVQQLCGPQALGCYFRDELIAPGEAGTMEGDPTPEEILRHEYGHHIASHRSNSPWQAGDWGPKNWASAANVCARVSRGEAFPGNEGRNYAQNPGEAWAEVYRLMDERKAGITSATWQIVAPSFFPDEVALQAAERDVLQPWTSVRKVVHRRVFGKRTKKVWWIPLRSTLDGELTLSATLPGSGLHEVALVSGNRRTVLKRAQWTGQRVKRAATTICGQRSLFVRVTQSGGLGRVTVTATTP